MSRFFTAALLLLAFPAGAEQLSLRQAVDEALARNPQIVAAGAQTAAARASLTEARSAWLPRIDASASFMRSDNPVFVFGSLLEQGRFSAAHFDPAFLNDPDPLRNDRLLISVRYTLFDQLRRLGSVTNASSSLTRADRAEEEARQAIRLETVRRYLAVTLAQERRNVAAEAVRAAEAETSAIRDRLQQGVVVESDLLSAEVQLAQFRQQEIEAEGEVAIAQAALATVLGRPASSDIAVEPLGEQTFRAMELDAALSHAAERGRVIAAGKGTEMARVQLRTARGSLLPRVDTFASWGASEGDPDTTIGAVVSFDIFDMAKPARIAAAKAGVRAAAAAENAERDAVTMEIVTAVHRHRAAERRLEVARRSAEQAEAAERIVRDRYENGLVTITEQLRAHTALVQARLSLLAARHDYTVGYAEVLRSTGGLKDVSFVR
jgi:outer membrane protein